MATKQLWNSISPISCESCFPTLEHQQPSYCQLPTLSPLSLKGKKLPLQERKEQAGTKALMLFSCLGSPHFLLSRDNYLIASFQYILFPKVCTDRTRGTRFKLTEGKFRLDLRKEWTSPAEGGETAPGAGWGLFCLRVCDLDVSGIAVRRYFWEKCLVTETNFS